MSFSVSEIILHNRAPFDHIGINFKEKSLSLLSALNGGGKTTLLSYIVDAWYEIVRIAFPNEFEGKEGKYYRTSSSTFSCDKEKASIVYVRFLVEDRHIDYVDVRMPCSQEEYNSIIELESKIQYSTIQTALNEEKNVKYISEQHREKLRNLFLSYVITYFPAYRHERPGYLNKPFDMKLDYNLSNYYSGHLKNPIEVISNLPDLANWLMDIVLDMSLMNDGVDKSLFNNINSVFGQTLSLKCGKNVFLGIGRRYNGATRIQIGERKDNHQNGKWEKAFYPSIFNMSSGENAIVCLFGEIVRQFDTIMPNSQLNAIEGIVLIDEVDKHLHIRLQTEILPRLFSLFPNVQFIISSHSPFISMGLYNDSATKSRLEVIDLDKKGMKVILTSTLVFKEAYDCMVEENKRFQDLYNTILQKQSIKLQIISEGKNLEHIKRAIELLNPSLLDEVEFPYSDKTGKEQLKHAYDAMIYTKLGAKCLFVWDCDHKDSCESLSETEWFFRFVFEKNDVNEKVKKGIENLYPQELFSDDMYSTKESTNEYGATTIIQEFNRNKFIEQVKRDNDSTHFSNFLPLIEKIKSIIKDIGDSSKSD